MIDDRVEEGCTEEEAVAAIGSVESIAEQIIADTPLAKIARERIKTRRRLRAWEIVLIVVGSPIWGALAVVALAVLLVIYAVLWTVVAVVWSVFAALAACAPVFVGVGIIFSITESVLTGLAMIGGGLACAGLAIFAFFGCLKTTKGMVWLTKKIALGIKKCFVRKEKGDA